MSKPTVISTFAGCGGSSLGYQMAGFDERLAVEWDDNAVATFKANFPDVPVYHGDICKLTVADALSMAGVKVGELDILDGSPPCQGFSTAGKRRWSDQRNQLFKEFVRLLRGIAPRCFVMENVSGMVKGKMKVLFVECLKELKASGYRVSARVLNAMYYGVPQHRQRLIFVGVREDLGIEPSHPAPQTRPMSIKAAWRNVKNTRKDLEEAAVAERYAIYPIALRLKEGQRPKDLGLKGYFGLIRPRWSKPMPAILRTKVTTGAAALLHPDEMRAPTLPEIKAAASFPQDFFFTDFNNGWERIGNSVPPLLMRAIAEHVKAQILEKADARVTTSPTAPASNLGHLAGQGATQRAVA